MRDFALRTGKREAEAKSLSNIGIVYRELGDLPKAIEFQEKALVLSEQIGDSEGAVGCRHAKPTALTAFCLLRDPLTAENKQATNPR